MSNDDATIISDSSIDSDELEDALVLHAIATVFSIEVFLNICTMR